MMSLKTKPIQHQKLRKKFTIAGTPLTRHRISLQNNSHILYQLHFFIFYFLQKHKIH